MTPSFRWQLKRSLSFRILVLCCFLLILPLSIHTLFMYREEYQDEVHDALVSLQILGKDRIYFLESTLEKEKQLLTLFALELSSFPLDSFPQITSFLEKRAKIFDIPQISIFTPSSSGLTCFASSSKCFSPKILSSSLFVKKDFTYLDQGEQKIWIGKQLTNKNFLVFSFPASWILEKINLPSTPFPVHTSLLDEQNKVIFSTTEKWKNQKFSVEKPLANTFYLQKREKEKNAYSFTAPQNYLAVLLPLSKEKWALLIDAPESAIKELKVSNYLWRIFLLFLFFLVIGGGLTYLFLLRFTQPLKSLFRAMQKVEAGDLQARFTPDWLGFEINILGTYFNSMMQSIETHQKEVQRQTLQRKIAERDLILAQKIQKDLLPLNFSSFPHLEIEAYFSPSSHVGGDFYDIFSISPGKTLFYIADIAGKGMEAGLFALTLRSYIRGVCQTEDGLEKILTKVNHLFLQDTEKSSLFATLWIALYDLEMNRLFFSSLGHPPAFLLRQEEIQELENANIALGVEEKKIDVKSIPIHKKDLLFFFTDGLFEAEDEKGQAYSLGRLKNFILSQKEKPVAEITQSLLREIERFQKKKLDDQAAMILRFKK